VNALKKYDAIIVLGGGRDNQGDLTTLSIQRLDKGVDLYRRGVARKIFALGGHFSTTDPKAIYFEESGAQLRAAYLMRGGVRSEGVVSIHEGRDTVEEAFVSRKKTKELGLRRILLVTSDKHLERALWIFRRIFGDGFEIDGESVPCGNLLNEDEEKERLEAVKEFFKKFPEDIPEPEPQNFYNEFQELFEKYDQIHKKYFPSSGHECQAYMGVRK
jgi:SanA protein